MLELVLRKSHEVTCVFILHHVTEVTLEQHGLLDKVRQASSVLLTERLGYFEMMKVLSASSFVITDGGSNQEECYYLGAPCCILRKATERIEGLDSNVVLSLNDPLIIKNFLDTPEKYRREPISPPASPSAVIARELLAWA
jgi:UDP-N-acetylglucosamine 2-epimerase (non-hydrolysing)